MHATRLWAIVALYGGIGTGMPLHGLIPIVHASKIWCALMRRAADYTGRDHVAGEGALGAGGRPAAAMRPPSPSRGK
jgi:hypothetical protein